MRRNCTHDATDLSAQDVAYIFNKNYRTILLWLNQKDGENDKMTGDVKYKSGKFPHAYKCGKCGQIIIPSSDISNIIKQMKEGK